MRVALHPAAGGGNVAEIDLPAGVSGVFEGAGVTFRLRPGPQTVTTG